MSFEDVVVINISHVDKKPSTPPENMELLHKPWHLL
jgi:hypothetical protein